MTLQFIIAMVAYAINERMAGRVDYLQEEVGVLKEALAAATGKTRIAFSPGQRRRLALKGKALLPEERKACSQIVRPETILAWFRQLGAKKDDSSKARQAGRPCKTPDSASSCSTWRATTRGWGYTKIRDALRGLRIEVGRTTPPSLSSAGMGRPLPLFRGPPGSQKGMSASRPAPAAVRDREGGM